MIIINNGNVFTDEQLNKIIKLLGKDYKPQKLVIYETRFDMLKHYPRCFNFSLEEFSGKLEGTYNQATDEVFVCIFAQDDDGDNFHSKQLYSLHALVHELRHRYQLVNNFLTADVDEEKAEKDADRFATNFINRKSAKISNIMGWEDEWLVEEEE
ncbi:hypothetical protein Dtox_3832 [Desulfofarcimen acetoxidans DSM 771]|uniref:Uncharacterized protein n=1 Tax=Desulfofarcimen acetoxidans (strain ATCC 49208 / DSM 771 / KCTC 5769 / VKM B-1644 / 5575) TaxID=485916 RepID=C8VXE0_DESAS|nr:hypothetical protein [Desulfofarcimen acetoxidans]ACV64536.1 hypothetical protein Dtox_3832 [Desulfofarcimen acetoxidans DSM 771]